MDAKIENLCYKAKVVGDDLSILSAVRGRRMGLKKACALPLKQ